MENIILTGYIHCPSSEFQAFPILHILTWTNIIDRHSFLYFLIVYLKLGYVKSYLTRSLYIKSPLCKNKIKNNFEEKFSLWK